VLRIEDTDRVRSKKEYLDEILSSIQWLGMNWDELYYQSERFPLYREYAEKLIKAGCAYEKEGAIFFTYTFKEIRINDLIRKEIIFRELPKTEEVIIKSDGSPTYNFSCVVDDALMGIKYVIRGDDHIPNTPKQILMYEALGFPLPQFAHVPMILSQEGGRMSKRFGATAIQEYRELGYGADALANYLLLLGWSPGEDREIISLNEAKELFDIKDVNKTAAAFSLDKLNWMSGTYIRAKPLEELTRDLKAFLEGKDFLPPSITDEYLEKVVGLFKERMSTWGEFMERSKFCFVDEVTYSEDTQDTLANNLSKEIGSLIEKLSLTESFTAEKIEVDFRSKAKELGLKAKDLVHPTRVALTGHRTGPGLFETMEVLGRERVCARLGKLIEYWGRPSAGNG